jgi:hypothetical protein
MMPVVAKAAAGFFCPLRYVLTILLLYKKSAMDNSKGVDTIFMKRIAIDEWRRLKGAQDSVINSKLRKRSGTITNPGTGRRYSVTGSEAEVVATLLHPDYERYQDMKKLRWGRTNSAIAAQSLKRDRKGTYTSEKAISSKGKGAGIHNRLIWGRMNTIAFRIYWDLKGEVFDFVKSKAKERNIVVGS